MATKKRPKSDAAATSAKASDACEIRCAGCGSLLAKLQPTAPTTIGGGALHLRRGDLEATFDGDFRGTIVCYRARCRHVNNIAIGRPR